MRLVRALLYTTDPANIYSTHTRPKPTHSNHELAESQASQPIADLFISPSDQEARHRLAEAAAQLAEAVDVQREDAPRVLARGQRPAARHRMCRHRLGPHEP